MAVGNKHMAYKTALNELELQSPGSKAEFYFGFLARAADRFENDRDDASTLGTCDHCGGPAESELCAFCRLAERASGADPVPVELILSPGRSRSKAKKAGKPTTPGHAQEPDQQQLGVAQ